MPPVRLEYAGGGVLLPARWKSCSSTLTCKVPDSLGGGFGPAGVGFEGGGVDTGSEPWYTVGGPWGCWSGVSVGVQGRWGGGWPPYCASLCAAAALWAWRLVRVAVPEMPLAAYRASMPSPGMFPGSTMGVSGGGGEPLLARTVDVLALDAKRFTLGWLGIWRLSGFGALLELAAPPGGGG